MLLSRVDQGRFVLSQERTEWVIIDLPEEAVLRLAPKAEDLVGTQLRDGGESLRMISAYSEMMFGQDAIADPLVSAHVSQTLIDLVGLALGAEKDAATIANERGMRAARLDAIVREIAASYLDPTFSVTVISVKLRLSPRYIQDLLQSTGSGFSDRVLELRLQHSVGLLARAVGSARKISDIAFSCGFNDLSYFHRCFRRRFGMTPTGVRAA
jgi:AraC-like DNA-binding protein